MAVKKKSSARNTATCYDASREKKWQAEADARTLIESAKLRNDKSRLSAAKAELQRQLNDLKKAGESK
jgi:hypothetical protein